MTDLSTRARGASVRLPGHFAGIVTIEEADPLDEAFYWVRVRRENGELAEDTIPEQELASAVEASRDGRGPVRVGPEDLFLLVEAIRIRLSFAHDPYFAVSLSGVDPYPHQLEAVYERMLPQTRLRFLLADDPGAGKTIMAGLLIKELRLRGVLDRVLVLCPAPLVVQWQDELLSKFDERFEIVRSETVRDAVAENPWAARSRVISSIDFAKRDEIRDRVIEADWDLVIIDEAHKCSASQKGDDIARTRRYQLAEALSAQAHRLLLLTATPHQGNPENFRLFLRLLDEDIFRGSQSHELLRLPENRFFLRRQKEDLRDFDGRRLFLERHVLTQRFELSAAELGLYERVTDFINTFLPRGRSSTVALARTVFQRRLASSLGAITRSLERRRDRIRGFVSELEELSPPERAKRLRELRMIEVDEEQDEGDQDEATADLIVSDVLVGERIEDLRAEATALEGLVGHAHQVIALGEETKLAALRDCLDRAELAELADGRGKLLIFTEHRDTLDYLERHLRQWGYSVVTIHGGMGAVDRRERQRDFQREAQICVATEAAGEGINLQFCHLMINYDMPWNPNRLEQRMGRIHRIGQRFEVHVFNFVAGNTVEGRILERLLEKLEEIRGALGDKVFDVVGTLLALEGVRLEEMLREAAQDPKRLQDYLDQIERISAERLEELERATEKALATSHVDLQAVREQDWVSEERRLMPEYVREFFVRAAARTGLRLETRADGLLRVEHVLERFRRPELPTVRRQGQAGVRYPKLTFSKADLGRPQTADAELLSPGHPLFGAVSDVLLDEVAGARRAYAVFTDPGAVEPYDLHFFEVSVVGEREGTEEPLYGALVAATVGPDGEVAVAAPDLLHDLTPVDVASEEQVIATDVKDAERHLRARLLPSLVDERRAERQREVAIREEYLHKAYSERITDAYERWTQMRLKAMESPEYRIASDDAERRWKELDRAKDRKLDALQDSLVVRTGLVRHVASARVVPAEDPVVAAARDTARVEAIAMNAVMQFESARGFEPEDVSRRHDGSGFDIRSLGPRRADGTREVRRIEVKGRAASEADVMLTPNEWTQARRHRESYWLYVVWNCDGEPRIVPIRDPVGALRDQVEEIVTVKGHRVPGDAIAAAAGAA